MSGRRIFFSRVTFLCWLSVSVSQYPLHPHVTAVDLCSVHVWRLRHDEDRLVNLKFEEERLETVCQQEEEQLKKLAALLDVVKRYLVFTVLTGSFSSRCLLRLCVSRKNNFFVVVFFKQAYSQAVWTNCWGLTSTEPTSTETFYGLLVTGDRGGINYLCNAHPKCSDLANASKTTTTRTIDIKVVYVMGAGQCKAICVLCNLRFQQLWGNKVTKTLSTEPTFVGNDWSKRPSSSQRDSPVPLPCSHSFWATTVRYLVLLRTTEAKDRPAHSVTAQFHFPVHTASGLPRSGI